MNDSMHPSPFNMDTYQPGLFPILSPRTMFTPSSLYLSTSYNHISHHHRYAPHISTLCLPSISPPKLPTKLPNKLPNKSPINSPSILTTKTRIGQDSYYSLHKVNGVQCYLPNIQRRLPLPSCHSKLRFHFSHRGKIWFIPCVDESYRAMKE